MPLPTLNPASIDALAASALHDRTIGTLVGSALGDTIGLYTEFLSAAHSLEVYPSRTFTLLPSPTPFKFDLHRGSKLPAHWTDDTDHALLLVLAFLHTAHAPVDPSQPPPLPTQQALAARLRVWVQQGLRPLDTMPLGLGRLVGTVVATKAFDVEPERVAREHWEKTGKKAAPNGSLMRTHPLGLVCLLHGEEEAFSLAADMSRVTHADPRCVLACVIGTGLVRGVARGEVATEEDVDGAVQRAREWFVRQGGEVDWAELEGYVKPESLAALKLDDSPAIGYVYKTLGSGLLLLLLAMRRIEESGGSLLVRSKLFEELITDLIMCGGDADTNACFAGALLGGYLGYGLLPDHWKHGLKHEEWLLNKAEALCKVLGLQEGLYDGQEDKDTHLDGGKGHISQAEMEGRWMVLQSSVAAKMEEHSKANATKITKGKGWSVSLPWQGKDKDKDNDKSKS